MTTHAADGHEMIRPLPRSIGPPALCGAQTTWDWEILAGDAVLATGRSVGRLAPDGRLAAITGFWLTAPPGVPTSVVAAG